MRRREESESASLWKGHGRRYGFHRVAGIDPRKGMQVDTRSITTGCSLGTRSFHYKNMNLTLPCHSEYKFQSVISRRAGECKNTNLFDNSHYFILALLRDGTQKSVCCYSDFPWCLYSPYLKKLFKMSAFVYLACDASNKHFVHFHVEVLQVKGTN